MSDIPSIKYGEFTIEYNEQSDRWRVMLDDVKVSERATLAEARTAADNFGKEKNSFKRVPVFGWFGWGGKTEVAKFGEITSLAESEYGSRKVWVSFKVGKKIERCKTDAENCHLDTPENRAIHDEYVRLIQESDAIKEKAVALLKTTVTFKVP